MTNEQAVKNTLGIQLRCATEADRQKADAFLQELANDQALMDRIGDDTTPEEAYELLKDRIHVSLEAFKGIYDQCIQQVTDSYHELERASRELTNEELDCVIGGGVWGSITSFISKHKKAIVIGVGAAAFILGSILTLGAATAPMTAIAVGSVGVDALCGLAPIVATASTAAVVTAAAGAATAVGGLAAIGVGAAMD